ncbi:unnamed protein product, partial [Staurois parvus]
MGTDRWHRRALTGGTDGATLIIRALIITDHMTETVSSALYC